MLSVAFCDTLINNGGGAAFCRAPGEEENHMAQKYTEARKEGNRKWDTANLDRLSIALPKGSRDAIKAHAAALGESTNAFIKRAIDCQMERDGAGGPQEAAGAAEGLSIP